MPDKTKKSAHEFRKDLVSGDWILIAPGRRKRALFEKKDSSKEEIVSKKDLAECPFEDPQKNGNNPFPILWYPKPGTLPAKRKDFSSWFVQAIPNKYPLLSIPFGKDCPKAETFGPQETLKGVGFHEVIITRDHFKTIDKMSLEEAELLLKAYQTRYQALINDPCINYVLIYHNQGKLAGATIQHPHSQLVALPVVDPDISRSLAGSRDYYQKHKKCIHCAMLEWEMKQKKRIVYQNENFITLVPFAPRASYETRIYPYPHCSRFEEMSDERRASLADSLRDILKRIGKALNKPDYNFFIHSAPSSEGEHYHWHMEILPHVSTWAGLELGVGIEVVVFSPEESARDLRRAK